MMTAPLTIKWGDGVAKIVPDDGHGHIATVRMRPTKTNNVAEYQEYARLFAAAPEMFAVMKRLDESGLLETLSYMDTAMMDDGDDPIANLHIEAIRATLAKAEGR